MNSLKIGIGLVREIENDWSNYINDKDQPYGGLRVRALLDMIDGSIKEPEKTNLEDIPWSFPLLPKIFQSIPKKGEAVLVFYDGDKTSQRYYIGPIISQPQYFTESKMENATSLLNFDNPSKENKPLGRLKEESIGAFPKEDDVAIIGRGKEDIILRYKGEKGGNSSEIDLRAGIRNEPFNESNPNIIGNVIFNDADPAYIQLKYKKGLCQYPEANSIINIVADRINIMSHKDENVAHNITDKNDLIPDDKLKDIMGHLEPIPLGYALRDFLILVKNAILNHVHPWAGMATCGDWGGYVEEMKKFDLDAVLSKCVRIS